MNHDKIGMRPFEAIDLFTTDFVEIKIMKDRVYVHTEDGLMFRAYRVGKIIIYDDRDEGGEAPLPEG